MVRTLVDSYHSIVTREARGGQHPSGQLSLHSNTRSREKYKAYTNQPFGVCDCQLWGLEEWQIAKRENTTNKAKTGVSMYKDQMLINCLLEVHERVNRSVQKHHIVSAMKHLITSKVYFFTQCMGFKQLKVLYEIPCKNYEKSQKDCIRPGWKKTKNIWKIAPKEI